MKQHFLLLVILLLSTMTTALAASSTLDLALEKIIQQQGLRGDPSLGRQLPSINTPLAQLGKQLFFSKALSGQMDTACASCHHPLLGGGDDLSLPIGVEAQDPDHLGPGRRHSTQGQRYDGAPPVPRNAPTTFNIALWDQVLFHDGRIESLNKQPGAGGSVGGIRTPDTFYNTADPLAGDNLVEAQARFPVTSEVEMRSFSFKRGDSNDAVRQHLVQRLFGQQEGIATKQWLQAFRIGFQQPQGDAETLITFDNISHALATYQRSQLFVDTPWRAYVQGDHRALSEAAKKGALLFFNDYQQRGAHCAACHRGDFFTDEQFHTIALPQIGRGQRIGAGGNADFGRFAISKNPADRYAFRTPTLLNVEVTGPYGHDGAYTTLEGIIRHHLNPEQAVANYDTTQLDDNIDTSTLLQHTRKALNKLEYQRRHANGKPVLHDVALSDQQVAQLLAFLQALTDPCVKTPACLAAWIPPDEGDHSPLLLLKPFVLNPKD
ncbi:Methylamine utilization protein mauG precursor [hydrothermal vent metagenome]|uniref:Methylamine utilization protein mauG n=1 Tax=hydrothermal vent metagenome TaxID=652676 RepID=A0A3B0Z5F5_9ZZZZ